MEVRPRFTNFLLNIRKSVDFEEKKVVENRVRFNKILSNYFPSVWKFFSREKIAKFAFVPQITSPWVYDKIYHFQYNY